MNAIRARNAAAPMAVVKPTIRANSDSATRPTRLDDTCAGAGAVGFAVGTNAKVGALQKSDHHPGREQWTVPRSGVGGRSRRLLER